MSARDDLIAYLTRRLAATVDEQDPQGTAERVVDCLTYIVDEHDDVETTTMGKPEREVIRQRWIVVKIPNGSEWITLPYERAEGDK